MKDMKVSSYTLERFRFGELNPDDNLTIRSALVNDRELRARLEELDKSDQELRRLYPYSSLRLPKTIMFPRISRTAMLAAAVLVCVLLPGFLFLRNSGIMGKNNLMNETGITGGSAVAVVTSDFPQDRVKGAALDGAELSIYLKGDQQIPLPDQSVLREGNTVQLAYTTPAGAEVIL